MKVHLGKNILVELNRRGRWQYGVDAAARTQGGHAIVGAACVRLGSIDPVGDVAGIEYRATVEAAGPLRSGEQIAVVIAESVDGLEVGSIEHRKMLRYNA